MKRIAILGSTGSVGMSTLEVLSAYPDRFKAVALTASRNDELLEQQILQFRPSIVALSDPKAAERLKSRGLDRHVTVCSGVEGLIQAATLDEADLVIAAIVGAAGLVPTLAAIQAGKDVALANKEPMVMAGHLVREQAQKHGIRIFPVDSEHSALFQAMEGHRRQDIKRIILTASGGPLWSMSLEQMRDIRPREALKHPTWTMGAKITIDSATLMNKGLEVIEAFWLFNIPASKIDVVIHRESIIHSMVEYLDGAVIAQLGLPDMKVPIAYALSYPERLPLGLPSLDLGKQGALSFYPPDHDRFPCLGLAYKALERGGTMPAVLNAANEVVVQAYLDERIGFLDIPTIIGRTMDRHQTVELKTLTDVLQADRWARERAYDLVRGIELERKAGTVTND